METASSDAVSPAKQSEYSEVNKEILKTLKELSSSNVCGAMGGRGVDAVLGQPGAAVADQITQRSQDLRETFKMMEKQTETLQEALQITKEQTSTAGKDTKKNKKNKRRRKARKSVAEVPQEKSFLHLVNKEWSGMELYNFRWNVQNTNSYKHLSECEIESILRSGEFFLKTGVHHTL